MLQLVEKIYEAAAIPELWPDALDAVSHRIRAAGCSVIAIDRTAPVSASSPGIQRDVAGLLRKRLGAEERPDGEAYSRRPFGLREGRRSLSEGGRRRSADGPRVFAAARIWLEHGARDAGARTALLLVTRLDAASVPDMGLLRALFDLTPTEARVAQELLAGDVGEETARRLGVGAETLKPHVKAVLRKTGFRRRVELVRFLAGLPSFGA
jgi:DNA-binding CsgD family transcriptional regulator